LKNDWFVNGEFVKEIKKGEDSLYEWNVKGLQNNFYEAYKSNSRPYRMYMEPQSDMTFTGTYDTTFDEKVFDLPNDQELDGGSCKNKCPFLSFCTFIA
jgi:hypothetical protein